MDSFTERFNNLPEDLKIYIHEFNPEHREKFKKVLEKLPLYTINFKLQILYGYYRANRDVIPDITYIIDEFFKGDLENTFNILSTCKCCSRHQQDRPKNLYDIDSVSVFPTHIHSYSYCRCKCGCRQFLRMLVRTVADLH